MPATRGVRRSRQDGAAGDPAARIPSGRRLATLVTALGPALLGWIVCAQFASVALNWTFYFVLGVVVATREVVIPSPTGRGVVLKARVS